MAPKGFASFQSTWGILLCGGSVSGAKKSVTKKLIPEIMAAVASTSSGPLIDVMIPPIIAPRMKAPPTARPRRMPKFACTRSTSSKTRSPHRFSLTLSCSGAETS
eukprot:767254-Hanusia_phi.AAC.1